MNSSNRDHETTQQMLSLINAAKCDPSSLEDQQLISALNRGGLWGATKEMQRVFEIAELKFKSYTNGKNVRSIPIEHLASQLLSNEEVQYAMTFVSNNSDLETEKSIPAIVINLLLNTYLKVRSHSYARSVVAAFKTKTATSKKALRKSLKQSSEGV